MIAMGGRCFLALAVSALLTVAAAATAQTATAPGPRVLPAHPFATAVYFDRDDVSTSPLAASRVAAAGATAVRLTLYWNEVAPAELPVAWNPADPADPHYDWTSFDAKVRNVVAGGLQPLVTVLTAPAWAQQGGSVPPPNSHLPDPQAFAQFATAVATRYDGSFEGLPRVRWWEAWNEPNISLFLVPQLTNGTAVSPGWYRKMLNGFADAVHGVHPDNLVVSAGLAPFRDVTPDVTSQDTDWGPMSFMRALLCLSKTLKPTCSDPVKFDVWAQHPYTSGGPTHHAVLSNDVSLGDLQKVRSVLTAAVRYGHVISTGPVRFWVTEFSWDTSPPDPGAVPALLARRWVAEGFYRMWANGVELVTWLMLRDDTNTYLQSGLYYNGGTLTADKPKPLLSSFRFPVVGLRTAGGVYVWGRLPGGVRGRVVVERRTSEGWRTLGTLNADRFGIFQRIYPVQYVGWVRARPLGAGAPSPPFQLANVPDRFFNPFGQTTAFEPGTKP